MKRGTDIGTMQETLSKRYSAESFVLPRDLEKDMAMEKAESHLEKEEYDAAISAYTTALDLDSTESAAYCGRGNAYLGKGDNDKAVTDYSEAIRLDPKCSQAYFCRGLIHLSKGDSDKAIPDFTAVIRLEPKFAVAYAHRAEAYVNTAEF